MFLHKIRDRLASGLVALAVIASPASAADISSQQVADGVWLFQGAGANVVAVSDGRNLLVVDGGLEENSRDLYEAIREATGARVISTLINTHWHPEQTGLNALAAESGATIIAHDQTLMYLSNTVTAPRLYGERRIPPMDPAARPNQVSRYGGELEIAGQRVQYGYLPAAHTNGDFYVFLPDSNVLVAGGAVGSNSWPVIDIHNGGIVGGHLAASHPDRVLRYITIGGIGFNITSTFPNEGLTRLVDFIEDPTRENIIAWLESMVYDKAIITDELIDMRYKAALEPVTMESSRKMYTRAALGFIAQSMSGPGVSQRIDYLGKIQAPTLIMWGRDDKVSPLDGALFPMRVIPNAELHVFPRCGHWTMIEHKDRFEALALDFLRG